MIFSSHATSPWEEWRGARCPACAWSRGSPRLAGPWTSRQAAAPSAGCTCPEQGECKATVTDTSGKMTKLIVTLFCLFHFVIFGIKYKYDLEEVSFICLRFFGVDGMAVTSERRRWWRRIYFRNSLQKHFTRGDLLRLSASGINKHSPIIYFCF